ncbi:glycosyl hydrolase 108 family protein [Neomegalonema sp.]|uniref:glycosyl hydrolase 108 family protein n=1 Tax=Neomegalonema sp. TaxID=2039713 RepID=UPI002609833E|nr:glycosyl hydrolase 108 family protein [Neomegalonema sp.]MDD2869647.1 glycosyl hydrolase 108 family protein [Neomegalonema sp.]
MDEQAKRVIDIIIDNEVIHKDGRIISYVNDKDDPGGETNWGISKRQYPNLIIDKLTRQDAEDIYFADYYSKLRCQLMDFNVALSICDFGVNAGIETSARALQLVINRLGNFNLVLDGKIGSKTIEAIKTIKNIGTTNYMLLMFTDFKKRFYKSIRVGRKYKYLITDLNRTDKIQDMIDAT